MKNILRILPAYILFVLLVSASVHLSSCSKNDGDKTVKIKCVTCMNGGLCINDSCRCPAGYEGINCELSSADKFTGAWNVSEKGSRSLAVNYVSYIHPDTVSGSVLIQFFNNYFATDVRAFIVVDSIIIPEQVLQGKRIVGKGITYYNPSKSSYGNLYMAYKVTDLATLEVNDYGYDTPGTSNSSVWNK